MSVHQPNLLGDDFVSHSNRGKEFERDLESTHSIYETRGIAKIDRHPSEWEFIGVKEYNKLLESKTTQALVAKTGNGYWMKRKATNVDYSGVANLKLLKFGVHIKFDAKMSKGDRISLHNFSKHQVDNLCASARCGAVAGFFVRFYDIYKDDAVKLADRVFFVGAEFVRKKMDKIAFVQRAAAGDGSISIAEMEKNALEIPYSQRYIDWHPVLFK